MTKFFQICFLLLPWIIIPNGKLADPFRLPKATFFDFICLGLICFSICNGLRKKYVNKYLSWFCIWVFITIGINWYLPFTLTFNNRQAINIWTLEPTIHFILALWSSYIALSYFEEGDYKSIAKYICFSSFLISFIGILQICGLDIYGKVAKYNLDNSICVFLDNPNIVGNYLALSLPFFLIQKNKIYIIGFILSVIALIFTNSLLSSFCGIIGLLIYLLLINRNKILHLFSYIALFFSMLILIFQKNFIINIMNGRIEIWSQAWIKFKENPIFGQGLGIFKTWELVIKNTKTLSAHNDWLEIAIMLGILGIVFLLLIIVNSFKKFNYKIENKIGFVYFSSFVTFLFIMLGSFPLEIAPLALFGLLNWWAVETL